MSNLLEQASLVMIPSGYAEDIVYSEIPLDGSGDLQLTRASNGTRVNSAGLVEVCPWNLLPNSEVFSLWNTVLIGTTITVTDNFVTAPNGTLTAAKVVFSTFSDFAQLFQFYSLSTTQNLTATLYAKVPSGTKVCNFGFYDGAFKNQQKTLTTEWQRIEYTSSVDAGTVRACWFYGEGGASNVEVHLWGGQVNVGSTAKPYFPTTDRLNVPRLTYQNGGGGCPSLLLEPQRTNLVLQSNTFNTSPWAMFTGPAVTPNTTTSPDGTTSATTLNSSGGTNDFLYQTLSGLTVGATYSFSFYIKNLNSTASRFWGPSGSSIVDLSWSGSTLVSISGTGASFTSVGNDWYRVVQTGTTPTATPTMRIYADVNNTSKSVYIYGAQFEAGSYPTSYIPTTSSSATRVLDVCAKTGVSSLIGQTEGTLFVEFKIVPINSNSVYAGMSDGTSANFILVGKEAGVFPNKVVFFIVANSTFILNDTSIAMTSNFVKCAIAYKSGNWAAYFNGTLVASGTSTFSFSSTLGTFGFGSNPALTTTQDSIEIKESVLFKTRLTNAELASLTTI